LKRGDLPLHQLNWKRGTILDEKDIAGEIKMQMMEKTKEGFLKAQDLVEIVASPHMQAMFMRKGITKPIISNKTALCWLKKLGWSYGKLKHGLYLDGQTWWNTGKCLSNVLWDMSDDSIDGITMGQNSHAPMDSQSLVLMDAFASSWSHTTSPPFSKMMSATQDEATGPASQIRRPRATARH